MEKNLSKLLGVHGSKIKVFMFCGVSLLYSMLQHYACNLVIVSQLFSVQIQYFFPSERAQNTKTDFYAISSQPLTKLSAVQAKWI